MLGEGSLAPLLQHTPPLPTTRIKFGWKQPPALTADPAPEGGSPPPLRMNEGRGHPTLRLRIRQTRLEWCWGRSSRFAGGFATHSL